nr:MAG TPA_asm: hypothetical protein [Caudoviricetes sp.]
MKRFRLFLIYFGNKRLMIDYCENATRSFYYG